MSDFSYPIVQKTQEDITILFSSAAISTLICISTKEELQVSILLFSDRVASTKVLSADHNAECAYTVQ